MDCFVALPLDPIMSSDDKLDVGMSISRQQHRRFAQEGVSKAI